MQIHYLTNRSLEVMAHQVVDTGDTGLGKTEKVPALMNSERNRHHTSKPVRKYRDSERD